MTDARTSRLFTQSQGWIAHSEAFWDEANKNAALELNGHPKAQDFEPKGGGGTSDPTGANGIRPDRAASAGRRMRYHLEQIWIHAEALMIDVDKLRNAKRPEYLSTVDDENCVLHREAGHFSIKAAHSNQVCTPCYNFNRSRGRFPTSEEIDHFETYAGRWPKERVDPKNPYSKRYVATKQALIDGVNRIEAEG